MGRPCPEENAGNVDSSKADAAVAREEVSTETTLVATSEGSKRFRANEALLGVGCVGVAVYLKDLGGGGTKAIVGDGISRKANTRFCKVRIVVDEFTVIPTDGKSTVYCLWIPVDCRVWKVDPVPFSGRLTCECMIGGTAKWYNHVGR